MPDLTSATFNLDAMTPSDLDARRRAIRDKLKNDYKGYDDPEIPEELLHELMAITAALRRRTAGPPKVAKLKAAGGKKSTTDDLLGAL